MRCAIRSTDSGVLPLPAFAEVPAATEVGRTPRAVVYADAQLGSRGRHIAEAVLDSVEDDIDAIADVFGNIALPDPPVNVVLARLPGVDRAFHHAPAATDLFVDVRSVPVVEPRYSRFLLTLLLVDLFEVAHGRGWSPTDAAGQALARAVGATRFPKQILGFATASAWLDGSRRDIATDLPRVGPDTEDLGGSVLFLNWLHFQLGFSWDDIVAAGGSSLAETYQRLAGTAEDVFTVFREAVDGLHPPDRPAELETDNPFPRKRAARAIEDAADAGEEPAAATRAEEPTAEAAPEEPGAAAPGEPWLSQADQDWGDELWSGDGDLAVDGGPDIGYAEPVDGAVSEWVEAEPPPPRPAPVSLSTLRRALSGATYPASRARLVERAEANKASARVLSQLKGLPTRRYGSLSSVHEALEEAR